MNRLDQMTGHRDAPRYRMLVGPEADRAVPPWSPRLALSRALAWRAGRLRLPPGQVGRVHRRLELDPRARSLRTEFADGLLGQALVVDLDPARLDAMLVDSVAYDPAAPAGEGVRALRLAHWFLDAAVWDDAVVPLARTAEDEEVEAVFHPGGVRASSAWARLVASMEAGRPEIRNGVALAEPGLIAAYFEHYERLRDSIVAHGFRRRVALPRDVARRFSATPIRGRRAEEMEREVGVAIDADGRLLRMVGGRHRTAIAQRLRLAAIPVQVRLVHVRWLRARMSLTGLDAEAALVAGIRAIGGT